MSLRESLYRLRRVAEDNDTHAEVLVHDVRKVLDSDARLRAEVKELRGKMERTGLERDALRDFVRGMADGYARAGQTQKEWTMRDVLADAVDLAPKRRAKR